MSPLSAIPPMMSGALSRVDLTPPEAVPMPAPSELVKPQEIAPGQPAGSDSFASMLGRMVSDISAQQNSAMDTVRGLESGQKIPLHQAVIAMEEANVSFQLMVEVRNRLLEAYQEIMRMQV